MDLQAAQVLGYIASLGQPALAGLLRMFRRFDAARQFAGGGGEAANAALRRARGRDAIFSPVATGLSVFNVRPPDTGQFVGFVKCQPYPTQDIFPSPQ